MEVNSNQSRVLTRMKSEKTGVLRKVDTIFTYGKITALNPQCLLKHLLIKICWEYVGNSHIQENNHAE
jgi:hypothetical protein